MTLVSETLSVVSVDWFGLDTAWRLKLAHAARHIDQLAKVCNAYRAQDPQHVDPEPTDQPGRTAYRLYVDVPIPVDISLIAGDVLHNLRSALNTLAFALVVNDIDRELTADEEKQCGFPICGGPKPFEDFFEKNRHRRPSVTQRVRDALRTEQPFTYFLRGRRRPSPHPCTSRSVASPARPLGSQARREIAMRGRVGRYSSGWRAMDWGSRPASSHPQIAARRGRPMTIVARFSTGICFIGCRSWWYQAIRAR